MSPLIENLIREIGYERGFTDFGPNGTGSAWMDRSGDMPSMLMSRFDPVLEAFAQAVAKRCAEIVSERRRGAGLSDEFHDGWVMACTKAIADIRREFDIDVSARQMEG